MSAELITRDEAPSRGALVPATPLDMLNSAVASGASVEVMAKLMDLYERWEAGQARRAFDAAVSAAKGEIPPIEKNKVVDFTSAKGRTNYRHEDLAEIARIVDPILHRHGLSYRHRAAQEGPRLRVTCILSHRDGYSEETTLEAQEDHSGNKNSIQAIGSAATYLQRYTLKLALGLATTADDDGKTAGTAETVSDEQIVTLREMIEAVEADEAKFAKFMKVDKLADLPASRFDNAIAELKAFGRNRGRA